MLMSKISLSLLVLAGSVLTRASVKMSVVSSFLRKVNMVYLLVLPEPLVEHIMLKVLTVHFWRRWDTVTAKIGSRVG